MLSLDQDSTVSDHAHRVTTDPAGESQQSLISPLRRLPNEIIARIFEYTCEENFLQEFPWHDIDYPSATPTKLTLPVITYLPAMTISSVCSRWRQLALSYPALWSNLRVEICILSHQDDIDGFIATLNRYLEASGNYPLNLELNILGQPLWPAEPLAVDCLTMGYFPTSISPFLRI
ncbi:hypothetical protein BT96DRAFT_436796 [Gymnopus androsaceus JB14]|uniref:Uncharacterized protein n=1 Tax=Gymnopus androsaceus JB14 TaxID=1447944 RepID=A0A6A4GSM9_9AGAR|nr:hypothetical protein BT96DRAFT_436796 [Gymnopus androsaceus JB14]